MSFQISCLFRNLLLNGLFALFDRMKIKDFQKLHMSLNPHSRMLLGELEELHKNDFRYFGKVWEAVINLYLQYGVMNCEPMIRWYNTVIGSYALLSLP